MVAGAEERHRELQRLQNGKGFDVEFEKDERGTVALCESIVMGRYAGLVHGTCKSCKTVVR